MQVKPAETSRPAHYMEGAKQSQLSGRLWLAPLTDLALRPLPEPDDVVLVFDPNQRTDENGKTEKLLTLLVHDRDDGKETEGGQCAAGRVAPDGHRSQPDQQQQCAD